MQILPLRTDLPDYTLEIALDEVTFSLRLRWSAREACWYLDISDEDDVPLAMGVKVVLSWPLGGRRVLHAMPVGSLYAFDTSGQDIGPGLADLGGRVQLVYYTAAERALLEAD